jgi:hypothetical protein
MSIESFNDQRAVGTTGSTHTTERRARGTGERRIGEASVKVAVFGGSRAAEKSIGVGVGVVWFATIVLFAAAWWVYYAASVHELFYNPGTGFGYYIGLVGGVMMLLMLLYPVRKHLAFARNWGAVRYWFMVHMIFGIGGPVLVLFHSTFHVKSLNAGVALYSMLLVALSGIIGRFIYKRIHHGLYGRRSNLEELQQAVEYSQRKGKENRVTGLLIEATGVSERLKQFREMASMQGSDIFDRAWKFMTFDWKKYKLARRSRQELWLAIIHMAQTQGWDKRQRDQHFQDALAYVNGYLSAVKQAAQFSAYERLFRLWHILHSPFVWLLGISGIVHVIATQFMY